MLFAYIELTAKKGNSKMQTLEQLKEEWQTIHNNIDWRNKDARCTAMKRLKEIDAQKAHLLPLEVGMFFYESWGYDQTNIDYLEVIEVSPTRKTVMCRMVGKNRDSSAEQFSTSDKVTPDNRCRGPTLFRLRVSSFGDSITLRGSYPLSENYYLECKLADQHRQEGRFKCPKYDNPQNDYELGNYFAWSQMARENHCKDCKECHNELSVAWREGSFSKYDHPMYETAIGFGH